MWLRQLPGSGSLHLPSPTNCLQTSRLSGPLFWSIGGCYRSSAHRDGDIQALSLRPPGSAGLDEAAHLHGAVNSLYVLISVTICVLARAGETGALGIYSRRRMWRGLLILCLLKTAPGQSRTASLALGTVAPASSGKEASTTCRLYPGGMS